MIEELFWLNDLMFVRGLPTIDSFLTLLDLPWVCNWLLSFSCQGFLRPRIELELDESLFNRPVESFSRVLLDLVVNCSYSFWELKGEADDPLFLRNFWADSIVLKGANFLASNLLYLGIRYKSSDLCSCASEVLLALRLRSVILVGF